MAQYKVIMEDKEHPEFGILTCIVDASDMAKALTEAEKRYPYYHAFYASLLLGGDQKK